MAVAGKVSASRLLRAKSLGIGNTFSNLYGIFWTIVLPYLCNSGEANLGGNIAWIYLGLVMWWGPPGGAMGSRVTRYPAGCPAASKHLVREGTFHSLRHRRITLGPLLRFPSKWTSGQACCLTLLACPVSGPDGKIMLQSLATPSLAPRDGCSSVPGPTSHEVCDMNRAGSGRQYRVAELHGVWCSASSADAIAW